MPNRQLGLTRPVLKGGLGPLVVRPHLPWAGFSQCEHSHHTPVSGGCFCHKHVPGLHPDQLKGGGSCSLSTGAPGVGDPTLQTGPLSGVAGLALSSVVLAGG